MIVNEISLMIQNIKPKEDYKGTDRRKTDPKEEFLSQRFLPD